MEHPDLQIVIYILVSFGVGYAFIGYTCLTDFSEGFGVLSHVCKLSGVVSRVFWWCLRCLLGVVLLLLLTVVYIVTTSFRFLRGCLTSFWEWLRSFWEWLRLVGYVFKALSAILSGKNRYIELYFHRC